MFAPRGSAKRNKLAKSKDAKAHKKTAKDINPANDSSNENASDFHADPDKVCSVHYCKIVYVIHGLLIVVNTRSYHVVLNPGVTKPMSMSPDPKVVTRLIA